MNKGSNLVEYVVPIAVIGLIVGLCLYNFMSEGVLINYITAGGTFDPATKKLSFGNTDISTVNTSVPPVNNTTGPEQPQVPQQTIQPDPVIKEPLLKNVIILDGQKISVYHDGSLSFTVGDQAVSLPPDIINNQKQMLMIGTETSGISGARQLIKDITYMIEKHQAEYPNEQVPLEISYGNGIRSHKVDDSVYKGSAEINSYQLKVGGHILANQHDQSCAGTCKFQGDYRIEGQVDQTGSFNATVSTKSIFEDKTVTGTFSGDYTGNGFNGDVTLDPKLINGANYDWNLNFNEPYKL